MRGGVKQPLAVCRALNIHSDDLVRQRSILYISDFVGSDGRPTSNLQEKIDRMDKLPLLNHRHDEQSAFTPQSLMTSVRRARSVPDGDVPQICILEFDGDITDWLIEHGLARKVSSWPCFHTTMFSIEVEAILCGIIPRTIGGPYSVLIAEQLAASGTKLIVGLTSAGRIAR